jgi:hypothetical protein
MKYLLPFLALGFALVVVGCGDDPIAPGTPVSSITICRESASAYLDCFEKPVTEVFFMMSGAGIDLRLDGAAGECDREDFDDGAGVVVGDEVIIWTGFSFDDGTGTELVEQTITIDDTAFVYTIPCPD